MDLREPEEITVISGRGKEQKFILSLFPAWDGLEILEKIPSSFVTLSIPKIADWEALGSLKLKIMKYVAVELNGKYQTLSTQALIDNHCIDGESFLKLLKAEVAYNNSFFRDATLYDFLAEAFRVSLGKLSEILTQSSALSSLTEKQPSTN